MVVLKELLIAGVAMAYILVLDTSGNWVYLAGVVATHLIDFGYYPHIARANKNTRKKIIDKVLTFMDSSCYGVCLKLNARLRVRELTKNRVKKDRAWRYVIRWGLSRLANHLRSKKYWPIDRIVADPEFRIFEDVLTDVFGIREVYVAKESVVILADVLGYVNLRMRHLLKKFRNIREL